jgi:hypothetical protein
MNNYIVRQKDIEVLMQSDKTLFYKLELLNNDMKVLDCIEGNLIDDSLNISRDSDIRRTYNCTMHVSDSTFDIGYGKRFFYDRLIRPYIGIRHNRSGEIIYYLLGTFIFTDVGFSYNATTRNLSLTCNDLMCMLNGMMGGNLPNYKRTITAGTDARTVVVELLKEVGITKYFIEFKINNNLTSTFEIPYDMVYNAGMTAYQIIRDIVDLYPGTEFYFSRDGICMIDAIPTSENEIVVLNDDILQPILISEQLNTSFKDIYNHIEIWGRINEPEYYSKDVTCTDNVYNVHLVVQKLNEDTGEYETIEYADELDNFDTFCLLIPSTNKKKQYIDINGIGNVLIVNDEGKPLEKNLLNENRDNVFRYRKEDNTFIFVGEYQVYAELYLTNNKKDTNLNAIIDVNNEYSIEKIGRKFKSLSGGDFDKIPTSNLAKQRCKLELYNATNRQVNLNLTTIAICWLDVSQLIEFTSNLNNKKEKYLIDSISCNFAEHTMSISGHKFFADYI